MMNWYLVLAILLFAVDFPILIGVYDLSTVVPGRAQVDANHRRKRTTTEDTSNSKADSGVDLSGAS